MMQRNLTELSRRLLCSASALAALGAAHATLAQTLAPTNGNQAYPPGPSSTVGEVVVTAQRVRSTLEKTPASISVLTADTIKTAGVQNFNDVATLIPNFTFTDGYRSGVPQISLRGIPTVQGGEAPAAFIVDGVAAPGPDFINQDLLDIANVQVLRGPQGGIYGRNAIGGAVVIETQQPTDEFHDTVTVDGGNGSYFQAINTASGALVPGKLWAKLTVDDHQFGGLIQNIDTNKPADSIKDYAGRLEILAKPTDTTTVELTYSAVQAIEGASYQEIPPNGRPGDFNQATVDFSPSVYDRRHLNDYSAKIDQNTSIGTLTSVSQFAETQSTVAGNLGFTPASGLDQYNPTSVTAFNEDVHLSSPADQPIRWIVGGFYQLRQSINYVNVYGQSGGPADSVFLENEHDNSAAWAGYAQASIPLPGNLKLDIAGRYDSDTRYDADLSIPSGPHNGISHTFGAFQPTATLSEQFTPDVMSYVTVGKGFRSGGFNGYADSNGSPLVKREYAPETDINYEIGIKSRYFGSRLIVNADIFHTDFTNEQYYLISLSPPARDIVTIKSVSYNGGEFDITYIPVKGLSLNASGGVADSTIISNDLAQNDHGKHSPDANLYTTDVSATYKRPISSNYTLLYRIDYSYKGPICYDSANEYCFHSVGFLNARLALEAGPYTLALWGKNILSVREPINFAPDAISFGVGTEMINKPATYGVELSARF